MGLEDSVIVEAFKSVDDCLLDESSEEARSCFWGVLDDATALLGDFEMTCSYVGLAGGNGGGFLLGSDFEASAVYARIRSLNDNGLGRVSASSSKVAWLLT